MLSPFAACSAVAAGWAREVAGAIAKVDAKANTQQRTATGHARIMMLTVQIRPAARFGEGEAA
jgi:hypothetical protein